ncbi:interleukin-1 receptor type 2-like [Odontesthes bonariensis]|uniref:interleukin-1 receptor type 2-like n=1 Tax=Odontesthes bonariensis TaxID=219752 RepID=UPI003F5895A3
MVCLELMSAVVIVACAYGQPPLPPLPMKDGCHYLDSELEVVRMEGEAVILNFPIFTRVLEKRKIGSPTATYLISKNNGTDGATFRAEGRVQQHDKELWLLPARASDSGEYICTYRNETYCVTGNITLHVYESSSVNMRKLSYGWPVAVGEEVKFSCQPLCCFNNTDGPVDWYKDSNPKALQPGRGGSLRRDGGALIIPAAMQSHAGLYTCRLKVLINNQQYNVSRSFMLMVEAPNVPPPVIVSPLNGTIFESSHGSGLELSCQVLTECPMADFTLVTWLVNGQSVESSYLDKRALQGGRRVTGVSEGCRIEQRLVIAEITDGDEKTEIKCVTENKGGKREAVIQLQLEDSTLTWLVVGAVAVSCLVTVVSIFLYVLFKPKGKKKMDYFLARQNSTFSF